MGRFLLSAKMLEQGILVFLSTYKFFCSLCEFTTDPSFAQIVILDVRVCEISFLPVFMTRQSSAIQCAARKEARFDDNTTIFFSHFSG